MKYFSFLVLCILLSGCYDTKKMEKNMTFQPEIDNSIVKRDSFIDIYHCPAPERKPNDPYPFKYVQIPPKFKDTLITNSIDTEGHRSYFQKRVSEIIEKNFNMETTCNLGLKGRQRINCQFEISKTGSIKNIKVRALHPNIEKETIRVIELLPQFIPAKHENKNVSVIYNIPILFMAED